jgi:hypothetical protein
MATKSAKANTVAMRSSEDDWQVESDLRTMMECEKIEKDPKRLAAVQRLAKSKLIDLAGIAAEGKDA